MPKDIQQIFTEVVQAWRVSVGSNNDKPWTNSNARHSFVELMRQAFILELLDRVDDSDGETSAEMLDAMNRIIEAIYRSA